MADTINALTDTVRGRVITPSDSDYDVARAVYNAMHDRIEHGKKTPHLSSSMLSIRSTARLTASAPMRPPSDIETRTSLR